MLLRESSQAIGEGYNEASVMGGQHQHGVAAGDELVAFGEALTLGSANLVDARDRLKAQIAEAGQIISTANVNGREIAIVQLHNPVMVGTWEVSGVEVPYPKPGHAHEHGWEHVEFVLNGAANTMDGLRQAFMESFPNLAIDKLQEEYGYFEDAPLAGGDQMPNPTLGIKVNGVGLKFHAHPIQVIVGHEG